MGAALTLAFAGCGRNGTATPNAASTGSSAALPAPPPIDASPPEIAALWAAAESGEADDAMRLADGEGSLGLVDGATSPERRRTALRALAYVDDFEALPFLASAVERGKAGANDADAADAKTAAETVTALAARRRVATDPEDAAALRAGCDRLLAFAKDAERPRALRIEVVRALRMLADRGCPKRADIPNDVNAPR